MEKTVYIYDGQVNTEYSEAKNGVILSHDTDLETVRIGAWFDGDKGLEDVYIDRKELLEMLCLDEREEELEILYKFYRKMNKLLQFQITLLEHEISKLLKRIEPDEGENLDDKRIEQINSTDKIEIFIDGKKTVFVREG